MSLKEEIKHRTGRWWPWLTLPVRVLRHLVGAIRDLPRMLRIDRVRATRRFSAELRRRLTLDRDGDRLAVAVDVTPYWEKLTGVGWYLHQLLGRLAGEGSVRLFLYGPTMFLDQGDPPPVVELPVGPSLQPTAIAVPPDILFPSLVTRVLRRLEPSLIARQRHDVVFAPNFLVPAKLRRSRAALVVMVHDLGVRQVRWSLDDRTREALEHGLEASLARAAAVITPSRAVGDELVAAGLAAATVVTPIHHGPGQVASAAVATIPREVPPRYALFVGTLEPRKNLALLLEVWPRLLERQADFPPLVVCGGWGWKTETMRDRVTRAQAEGWLFALGYVGDASLLALYRGARFLVFPSLYEGFGLPLLEAMAVGCPVVCSDLPVFREVAGTAAEYAPPADASAWLEALLRVQTDARRRAELTRLGLERAGSFDWDRSARETLDVWRGAAGLAAAGAQNTAGAAVRGGGVSQTDPT
jgi:alpha-1,3-rhamnosyl/mannosyltransferase